VISGCGYFLWYWSTTTDVHSMANTRVIEAVSPASRAWEHTGRSPLHLVRDAAG
jgi:hypothetical protein